jgi:hypothetical protein
MVSRTVDFYDLTRFAYAGSKHAEAMAGIGIFAIKGEKSLDTG